MSKNKKIIKKVLVISMVVSSFATATPNLVRAATNNDFYNPMASDYQQNIFDLEQILNGAIDGIGKTLKGPNNFSTKGPHMYRGNSMDPLEPKIEKFSVTEDGPSFSETQLRTVDSITLNNDTNHEQVLSTNGFSVKFTNAVTSAVTHAFKLGGRSSAALKIADFAQLGIELSPEYSVSNMSSTRVIQEYLYTSPSQNIKVPAYSSAKVSVKLSTIKRKGTVGLRTTVSGRATGMYLYADLGAPIGINNFVPIKKPFDYNFNQLLSNAISLYHEDSPNIVKNQDGETIDLLGRGIYEAHYGTDYQVQIEYINNKDRKKRELNKNYTYTLKPQITKLD